MGKPNSYLSHAITPPSLEAIQAPRPRLIRTLNTKLDKSLILISAPAGYGKTTLLAEFTSQADCPVCWVRLTAADQDVMRFADVLWSSLSRRFRRIWGAVQIDQLTGASARALARAIGGALRERIGERFAVILDDVHSVNPSKDAMGFIDELVNAGPDGQTIVASGRELPDIPLVQLLASDEMAILDADSLALRADELAEVVKRRTGEEVDEALIGDLMEETGGWVTGVLLSERLVSHQVPSLISADEPLAYEYLASAVFDRQPDELQQFMLDSSVLPVMTAELCDAVLGRDDSQAMLDDLLRRSIFISVTDDEPRMYEYHQLFAGFLDSVAGRIDEGRRHRLLVEASSKLPDLGEWAEVMVERLMGSGETKLAKAMALKLADRVFHKGRLGTLRTWTDYFKRVGVGVPRLNLHLAALLEAYGFRAELPNVLALANNSSTGLNDEELLVLQRRIICNKAFSALAKEDWSALDKHISSLRVLLKSRSDPDGNVALLRLRAFVAADYQADWDNAMRLITAATDGSLEGVSDLDQGLAWTTRAYIECYAGSLASAEISATKAVTIFQSSGILYGRSHALMNLAYVQHLRGKFESAQRTIRKAMDAARQVDSVYEIQTVEVSRVEMTSELGKLQAAKDRIADVRTGILQAQGRRFWKKYAIALEANFHRRTGDYSGSLEILNFAATFENAHRHTRLSTESIALLSRTDPAKVVCAVRHSRTTVPLTAQDWTLGLLFLSRACFALGYERKARWWGARALRRSLGSGAIQMVATELISDPEFRWFLHAQLPKSDEVAIIESRIKLIEEASSASDYSEDVKGTVQKGVRLKALGPPRVWVDERLVTSLTPLELSLLVRLAECRHERSELLAELFWPGKTTKKMMGSLHTAIYRLRQALGNDVVHYLNGSYFLSDAVLGRYDSRQFSTRVAQTEESIPRQGNWFRIVFGALDLYSGPFMDGYEDQWILERRARLEIEFSNLATKLAKTITSEHGARESLPYLRKALALDPYREDLNHAYINILRTLGRRTSALQHERRYRKLVKDELGIDTGLDQSTRGL